MGVVFDSSVLIAAERQKIDWKRLQDDLRGEDLFIAAITLSEIWHGYYRANDRVRAHRLHFVTEVQELLPVLAFGVDEALVHARASAELAQKGQPVGNNDLIIGATALTHHHSVATLNEGEFLKIPSLRLEPVRQYLVS